VGVRRYPLSTDTAATDTVAQEVLFSHFPFRECLQESIRQAGFEKPTPIQAQSIGPALEGQDVIGLAQTGTGKTAAFALPIINRLAGRPELGALVLAPTRELAAQISEVFNELGRQSGIHVATIVGGVPMEQDYASLRAWPNVLVATPGRLLDHISSDTVSLDEIEVLAVDEADRMHDMGFIPQIRDIIEVLPRKRQTLMFTATMHEDVERIVRKSMRDPVRVQIGVTAPAHRARQELLAVTENDKPKLLLDLLKKSEGRVLVFTRTKRGASRLASRISRRRVNAGVIHGDLDQPQRDRALGDFRDGRCRILVATDIAARGLDISNIEHVINYDFPHNPEDYVHRIGRTARVEASGVATSFVAKADMRFIRGVRKLIGDKLPEVTIVDDYPVSDDHLTEPKKSRGRYRSSGGRGPGGKGRGRGRGRGKKPVKTE
jgi:ATP-dependent RNA helicase RhlE